MATRKAKTSKSKARTTKRTSTKRASTKKVVAKKASTKKRKSSIDESRKIKAFAGQEHHFYKGFPRGEAYRILDAAPKRTMVVKDFLDAVEKLPKVKNRKQAHGIVQKLVGKPNEAASKNRVCTFV